MSYDVQIAKERIGQVFRYLAEMYRVRTPPDRVPGGPEMVPPAGRPPALGPRSD
jgi:hypothetical protein